MPSIRALHSVRNLPLLVATAVALVSCSGDPSGPLPDSTPSAGSPFRSLSMNGGNACALNAGGDAFCWGNARKVPTKVRDDIKFASVAAGFRSACGLTTTGAAYCWLSNTVGTQFGFSMGPEELPVPVPGGRLFTKLAVSGGPGACGLTVIGSIYCWIGTADAANAPSLVSGARAYKAITAGYSHFCALAADGAAYCWGDAQQGKLGDGSKSFATIAAPSPVLGGHTFSQISAGTEHTCAVTTDGAAYCWGSGAFGRVGDGNGQYDWSGPTAVVGGRRFATVSAGGHHTCGVTRSGQSTAGATTCMASLATGDTLEIHRLRRWLPPAE